MEKAVQELLNVTVNKLIQTVGDNVKLVGGIDSEIMNLTSDIETFNARLVDSYKNPWANELQVLEVVRKKFQGVVNEAQDAVAKYISLQKKHKDNVLAKCLDNIPVPVCGNVNVSACEIQLIREKLHTIRQDHEKDLQSVLMGYLNNTPPPDQAQPVVDEDYANIFEDDLRDIKKRLFDASDDYMTIPIVGMPGIGKTAFAKQIFDDPDIRHNKFAHYIWVQVSHNFNRKQKFLDILDQITKDTKDIGNTSSEDRLEARIKDLLRDKKYFIVAVDVWETKDWTSLQRAFPQNSKGSRALVTTRHHHVANSIGKPHTLKVLSDKDSWSMLKRIVFGGEGCNMLFKPHGKKIAEKCRGIPLVLTLVAGILRKYKNPADWERVAKNPFKEMNRNDQSYHEVVKLSYDHLPHEKLKNCFLYFACFPMGHEIAAWKLIRLWIAEEFIPTKDDYTNSLDIEVEAKKYLNELVDRNLVKVLEKSADGQIKLCRIHSAFHEFCKSEAARKTLIHVMEGEQQRLDANTMPFRRLCFHSSIAKIFDEENYPSCSFFNLNKTTSTGGRVHSLLFSSSSQKSEINLNKAQLAIISNTFQNLRVLDIESFESELLPNELYYLSLLRYLAISTKLDILPERIEKLGELVTLIFRTTKPTLEIKGSIWNMKRLMHLHTNTSTQLPSPSKSRKRDSVIQTLSVISPASCTKEIFSKTPKLKKLGVRGSLVELLDENKEMCMFKNLQMLGSLENLTLHGESERVFKVPAQESFPTMLRKLTLSNTLFEWNDMSILGSLKMLEVLKLDENAFIGEHWDLSNEIVFEKLQYLRIGKTNLVIWNATENSFPVLEHLVLIKCIELEEIPNAFAKAQHLKVMELFHVTEKAANSARNVCKQSNNAIDPSINSVQPQSNVHKQSQDEENVNIPGTSSTSLQADESDEVGFDNEVKTIKNRLKRGSKKLKIISIVGLNGLGKTTLANMLFNDNEVQYEFFPRLRIDVSRPFDAKKTFRNILSELTNKANEYDNMSDEVQLANTIKELLESEKYLIVMEDVLTMQDWDCLKIAFPNNKRGSRVLVTTRHHEVGFYVDSSDNPHQLKFLTNEESWELLEKKVFCKAKWSPSTEDLDLGKRIAENCKGLPLAVVSVANFLEKNNTPTERERIANDRFAAIDCMNKEDNPLVQLIFNEMDFQLRECFMYLAAFPKGHEIAVRKLIRLWKAEGFIMLKEGGYTSDFEHTAEKYLKDLIDMNLLKVLKRRADGRIKTCCVDKTLYKFCKTEAAKKNLCHEIAGAKLEVDQNYRRLCVHSSVLDLLKSESKPSSKHVRSFLSSCKEEIDIPDEHLATIPKSFPILRVVDVESLKLKSLPDELYHLDHLRYLAVSTDLNLLPENFSHFQNMETLVLKLSQKELEIKANIWSMPKLRHLCSNVSMQLPPPAKISHNSSGSNIETLKSISPSSCTGEILDMTPNLQKLGISGDLVELMGSDEGGISLFDNLQKLRRLRNLKLKNESTRLESVPRPQHNKFPQRLRKLTLWNTSFEWKDMSILGELNELEVLKLEEDAFIGKSWELNNVVFKQLQFLRIKSNNLASWTTSHSCFPELKTLELNHCHYLEAVPDVFADVDSLEFLNLYHTTENAANSAREIKRRKGEKGNAESNGFKLDIYPPNH